MDEDVSSVITTVLIQLLDINDQIPFISSSDVSNVTISSKSNLGSVLSCFNPHDADADSIFQFYIIRGDQFVFIDRFKGCLFLLQLPTKDLTPITVEVSDGQNQIQFDLYLILQSKLGLFIGQLTDLINSIFGVSSGHEGQETSHFYNPKIRHYLIVDSKFFKYQNQKALVVK